MAPEAIRHETSGDDQPPDSDRADARTETIQAGSNDSVEFTATEDGTVHFFCDVPGHEQAGMTGRLKVE